MALTLLLVSALAITAIAAALLVGRARRTRAAACVVLLGALSAAAAWAAIRFRVPVVAETAVDDRPIRVPGDDYTTSDTCRSCHPLHYDTWRESYHSTMTQLPTARTVLGNFDGRERGFRGRRFRFERREDSFWFVETFEGGSHRVERPIVMLTGSHHLQVYWYATGESRELANLPFVWLIEDRRWIPYDASFVTPPREEIFDDRGLWPRGCIRCHATQGRPGLEPPKTFRSEVTEFGIACEACHGPAREHVRVNTDPRRRYSYHLDDRRDETTVHPVHLPPLRSSQVCGQCHGVWVGHTLEDDLSFYDDGYPYRPGDDIRTTRLLFQPRELPNSNRLRQVHAARPLWARGAFWPDGMVRVTGREYPGMIESPCYAHDDESAGILSCYSCHRLHQTPDDTRDVDDWTDDQLHPGMDGDAACLQCHDEYTEHEAIVAHTHHEAGSTGSLCYNCHMPHTTYGLLKAIRSHLIDSPTVQSSLETGRPNACNQCHLDKTLAWTAEHLESWYETPRPELSDDERNVSAAVLWLLRGDAGQRALMAWTFGWDDALAISGRDWVALYLAHLLDDPYDAVRFIAYRSLRGLAGYAELEFDFDDTRQDRAARRTQAMEIWSRNLAATRDFTAREATLIDPRVGLLTAVLSRLAAERDDTPITLEE